jgi:toxin ParE1/3/4
VNVRLSGGAEADLAAISDYLEREHGPEIAERLLDYLFAGFEKLAEAPGMGSRRHWLKPGERCWPRGSYLIIYCAEEDLLITSVLHGSRDLECGPA